MQECMWKSGKENKMFKWNKCIKRDFGALFHWLHERRRLRWFWVQNNKQINVESKSIHKMYANFISISKRFTIIWEWVQSMNVINVFQKSACYVLAIPNDVCFEITLTTVNWSQKWQSNISHPNHIPRCRENVCVCVSAPSSEDKWWSFSFQFLVVVVAVVAVATFVLD